MQVCCALHNHLLTYNGYDNSETLIRERMEDDDDDLIGLENPLEEEEVIVNFPRGAVSREGEEIERRNFLKNHYWWFRSQQNQR